MTDSKDRISKSAREPAHEPAPAGEPPELLDELRADRGPDLDFDVMEAALMKRVAVESQRRRQRSRASVVVGALAFAAAAALIVSRSGDMGRLAQPSTPEVAMKDVGAGELESGAVSVRGHVLARGETVHRGDELESARAVLRSSGRVVYAISGVTGAEPARLTVTETDRPIVLALSRGVVEAQVDKVPSGEAFAVDVSNEAGSVRIAVHGTHLRVERVGGHVTLDLTEGIVNVGPPPRSGSTYGKLVTAPAHVEFDVGALEGTFTMTKDLDRVRAAEDLSPGSVGALGGVGALGVGATGGVGALVGTPAGKPIAERGSEGVAQGSTAREPLTVAAEPTPSAREPKAAPLPVPGVAVASAPELKDPGLVPPPAEPRVDARTAISDAIASCARAKLQADRAALPRQPDQAQGGKPGELTLTVSSTLSVRVGDDGYAQAARFEPPLDPTVQKCAGSTIFKVHFTEPGSVMMPVSLSLH